MIKNLLKQSNTQTTKSVQISDYTTYSSIKNIPCPTIKILSPDSSFNDHTIKSLTNLHTDTIKKIGQINITLPLENNEKENKCQKKENLKFKEKFNNFSQESEAICSQQNLTTENLISEVQRLKMLLMESSQEQEQIRQQSFVKEEHHQQQILALQQNQESFFQNQLMNLNQRHLEEVQQLSEASQQYRQKCQSLIEQLSMKDKILFEVHTKHDLLNQENQRLQQSSKVQQTSKTISTFNPRNISTDQSQFKIEIETLILEKNNIQEKFNRSCQENEKINSRCHEQQLHLKKQLRDFEGNMDELRIQHNEQINEMEIMNNVCKARLQEKVNEVNSLQCNLNRYELTFKKIKEDHELLDKQYQRSLIKILSYDSQESSMKQEYLRQLDFKNQQIQNLKELQDESEIQLNKLHASFTTQQNYQNSQTVDTLHVRMNSFVEQAESLQINRHDHNSRSSDHTQCENIIKNQKNEIKQMAAFTDELESIIVHKEQECSMLFQQLEKANFDIEDIEKKHSGQMLAYSVEVMTINNSFIHKDFEIKQLTSRVQSLQQQNEDIKPKYQVNYDNEEIQQLQDQLKEQEEQIRIYNENLIRFTNKIRHHESEISFQQSQLEDKEIWMNNYQELLDQLKKEKEVQRQKNFNLIKSIRQMTDITEQNDVKIAELETEILLLKQRIEDIKVTKKWKQ